jgi:hypothetical protein
LQNIVVSMAAKVGGGRRPSNASELRAGRVTGESIARPAGAGPQRWGWRRESALPMKIVVESVSARLEVLTFRNESR